MVQERETDGTEMRDEENRRVQNKKISSADKYR